MPQLTLEGRIFSGKGAGKRFIDLPWVKRQIQDKIGFLPYSGTLNIRLTEQSEIKKERLDLSKGLRIIPEAGYYSGVLFKASIDALECAVVVPLVPNYPSDVLEVIAPIYLRGKLGLADGSLVAVTVTF